MVKIGRKQFEDDDPLQGLHRNRFLRRNKDPKPEEMEEDTFVDLDAVRAEKTIIGEAGLQ